MHGMTVRSRLSKRYRVPEQPRVFEGIIHSRMASGPRILTTALSTFGWHSASLNVILTALVPCFCKRWLPDRPVVPLEAAEGHLRTQPLCTYHQGLSE